MTLVSASIFLNLSSVNATGASEGTEPWGVGEMEDVADEVGLGVADLMVGLGVAVLPVVGLIAPGHVAKVETFLIVV